MCLHLNFPFLSYKQLIQKVTVSLSTLSDNGKKCICNLCLCLPLQTAQPDPIEIQRQQEARRRAIARKRAKAQLKPRSPEPVEGRKHIDVQTELYLEELSDRVEEADVETQTDAFLDRPPSPLFIPAKSGVDVATQILEGEVCCRTLS